jgi:hypothetical protein
LSNIETVVTERLLPDSVDRSKKVMVTSSLITIFFATIVITSGEISIFGFSILVQQQDIIAFGRFGTLLALIFFILFVFPITADQFIQTFIKASEARRDRDITLAEIAEGLREDEAIEIDNDFDAAEAAHEERVAVWQFRRIIFVATFSNLRELLLEIVVPLLFAYIAIISPASISTFARTIFPNEQVVFETVLEIEDDVQNDVSIEAE